jgi:hypothetical protein
MKAFFDILHDNLKAAETMKVGRRVIVIVCFVYGFGQCKDSKKLWKNDAFRLFNPHAEVSRHCTQLGSSFLFLK